MAGCGARVPAVRRRVGEGAAEGSGTGGAHVPAEGLRGRHRKQQEDKKGEHLAGYRAHKPAVRGCGDWGATAA